MNNNNFIDDIINFLKEAGIIALKYMNDLNLSLKSDMSIVTNADTDISKLFRKKIQKYLDTGTHKILDEENLPNNIDELFDNNIEYIWTIDPIDGTTMYYHGFPLWAIAVALYKNKEPYISAIYMPITKELIYTDSINSYIIKNCFDNNENKEILISKPQELKSKSVILQHKFCGFRKDYTIIDLYACYVMGFYTILGRSIGSFFNSSAKLWDISAIIPIAKNLGLTFKNIKTGQEIDHLDNEIINEDWSINGVYLLSRKDIYDKIMSVVDGLY